ncbi:MAG: hypothetical protein DRP08_07540 [Candidatus Aenigmatarchaeota archaeon]|nr:MAG: hypothetical protein DRP08_07540 [Candidatus Aenigmarchaeota archaeon]
MATKIITLYANTWEGLLVKTTGYYHDHCVHHYSGSCDDLPLKFKKYKKNNVKYVFICEEDIPNHLL